MQPLPREPTSRTWSEVPIRVAARVWVVLPKSWHDAAPRVGQDTRPRRSHGDALRRDRGGSALRGLTDRDVARTEGLPSSRRRSGDVSERHDLDSPHPCPGGRGAPTLGPARPCRGRPGHRRSTRTSSTSARSRSRARREPRTHRDEQCSTSFSSTLLPRRERRSAKGSRWRASSSRTVGSRASEGTRRAARPSPSVRRSSSAPTVATHSSPTPSARPSTTRSRSSSPRTTATGATCRWRAASRTGSGPYRGMAAWPTNDDLTLVVAGWPYREFEAKRNDVERHFFETLDTAPEFAERVRAAKREERFVGAAVPGLLPEAPRRGLGAGGRCRLQQGLHHGAGHQRRVPRRRGLRGRAASDVHGRASVRGGDGRVHRRPGTLGSRRCTS